MMKARTIAALLALGLAVSACSSNSTGGSPLSQLAKNLAGRVKPGQPKAAAGAGPSAAQLQAAVASTDQPLLFIVLEGAQGAATMLKVGSNQGFDTYSSSPDLKQTLTLRDGVVSSSRGFGTDLLSSDVAGTVAALRTRGPSTYTRQVSYLGGDRQPIDIEVLCTTKVIGSETVPIVTGPKHDTTKMEELCKTPTGAQFVNLFWVGADGMIWQSKQFIHPELGAVVIQVLRR